MREFNNFVKNTGAMVAMASIVALGTGLINMVIVVKMMVQQPENWFAFLTQICLAGLFIIGGSLIFIARQQRNFWMEYLTLPIVNLGAVITLVLYIQTVTDAVVSFNSGITVLIITILEIRRRELKKIHEALKISQKVLVEELPS